jgi:hypothetical protein
LATTTRSKTSIPTTSAAFIDPNRPDLLNSHIANALTGRGESRSSTPGERYDLPGGEHGCVWIG